MSNTFSWRFPLLDGGELKGFNDTGIRTFTGSDLLNNLAREIVQNSLDASANDKPVIVDFRKKTLSSAEATPLKDLNPILDSCYKFWEQNMDYRLSDFINEAKALLNGDKIDFLVISDYNTKGLSGARKTAREKSVFNALTSSIGVNVKGSDTSAGSYGIGKNAPFACSKLQTVFYNTYAMDDETKAFKGVARLVSHFDNNQKDTQGVGYFENINTRFPVFDTDLCRFRDIFARSEYGTDVIISAFISNDDWIQEIERAIIVNFFSAIHNNKLIVRIQDIEINSSNLKDRINWHVAYENRYPDKVNKKISVTLISEFYSTLLDPEFLDVGGIVEKDDIVMYLKRSDKFSNKVVKMRSSGMLIELITKNKISRYSALVIAKGDKLNVALREMENPTHNKWDYGNIQNNEQRKAEGKKILQQLTHWVNQCINDRCKVAETDDIDLAGISQFLPLDGIDMSLGSDEHESDTVDSIVKINDSVRKRRDVKKIKIAAVKTQGHKTNDETEKNEPSKHHGNRHTPGGIADPEGADTVIVKGEGKKLLSKPVILEQRIMKLPEKNAYRIIFKTKDRHPMINIKTKSIGDDGSKDDVNISYYKVGRERHAKRVEVNSGTMTLRDIEAQQRYEVIVYFEDADRMCLLLDID